MKDQTFVNDWTKKNEVADCNLYDMLEKKSVVDEFESQSLLFYLI